ncbi:MAG TPA: hypothetical protein VF071_01710 [Candidatus Limnocylindria bacterium]
MLTRQFSEPGDVMNRRVAPSLGIDMKAIIGVVVAIAITGCGIEASPSGAVPSDASPDASTEATAAASSSTTPTSHPSNTIVGVFNGGLTTGIPCFWITDQDGIAWELMELPSGYRVEFDGNIPILYADEVVVARGGDRLEARGTPDPPDIGSVCMVGRIFLAEEVHAAGSAT